MLRQLRHREIPSFVYDPSCVLYLPLRKRDGATFISEDAYGHLATVTGATWGLQGRTFDGTDDYISVAASVALRPVNVSLFVWCKPGAATDTVIVGMPYDGGATWNSPWVSYTLYYEADRTVSSQMNYGGTYFSHSSTLSVPQGRWSFVGFTYDGVAIVPSVDGRPGTSSTTPTGNIGYGTPVPQFSIGIRSADSLGNYFAGDIEEILVYNRALTALETQRIYLEGKWKYQ